jgi:hypothetical protein
MDGRGALATVLANKMEQLNNELQHVDNDKNDATKVEDFTNDTPPSLLVSTVSMVELIGSGVRRAILATIHENVKALVPVLLVAHRGLCCPPSHAKLRLFLKHTHGHLFF